VWRRFAATLSEFSTGRYISELHFKAIQTPAMRGFRVVLGAFVRGRVYLHFDGEAEARAALEAAGFATVAIKPAVEIVPEALHRAGSGLVHIIEASTVRSR
jgi:hypothetical protein